ncbi:ATP-binding protein [Formicincola oecophyllae]|nr:ATP-binding protein [Formicincola oecophyllae]
MLVRILLLNLGPLVVLAGMLLSITQFQTSLLESDVTSLREEARIYADALSEVTVHPTPDGPAMDPLAASSLLQALMAGSGNAHVALYNGGGQLVVAMRRVRRSHGSALLPHPPALGRRMGEDTIDGIYGWLLSRLPLSTSTGPVPFEENPPPLGQEPVGMGAKIGLMMGEGPARIKRTSHHEFVITISEPVLYDGVRVGEIILTRHDPEIDHSLFAVRSLILTMMLVTLAVSAVLSFILALTIARPLRHLALASQAMGESAQGRTDPVPAPLLARRDEIGSLARALRTSTLSLWGRIDGTERFASEVCHELKNPLASIRSALETLPRLKEPTQRQRLLSIVRADVARLERLIADISDASRVEGDLSRRTRHAVAVVPLLALLVELHQTTRDAEGTRMRLEAVETDPPLAVMAVEDRLVQALRGLISNAISFSPPQGTITLRAKQVQVADHGSDETGARLVGPHASLRPAVEIVVEDEGPGIPPDQLENIFERFYSERPQGEGFGQHSGLGLAICRQIITALDGTVKAENVLKTGPDGKGHVAGARFVVILPCAPLGNNDYSSGMGNSGD